MNRPHFRRRPRPTDPDPYTRLDWLDGLPGRDLAPDLAAFAERHEQQRIRATVEALDGLPTPTRYDAEWPDVLAAEAPGGDLAAMAAPLPGMARDDLGTYAEPVEGDPLYQVGPDGLVTVLIEADVSRFRDEMAHAARKVAELTVPVKPRGRHRQTDPLDLILADLRDLDGLS